MALTRKWTIDNGDTFEAPSYETAHSHICSLLAVDGPRALTARNETGGEVHASLYDGEDYTRDSLGRYVWKGAKVR